MTWIKICGITNLEDAQSAVDAGADAVGFVFYEKSRRFIGPKAARDIVSGLPAITEKVGVFVGQSRENSNAIGASGVTAAQTHYTLGTGGHQSKDLVAVADPRLRLGLLGLSAALFIPGSGANVNFESFSSFARAPIAILLDNGTPTEPGGTGKTFDWAQAAPNVSKLIGNNVRVVIAGGLTPDNVGEAIRILHPWGVDVCSGVEASPGKKDPKKIRAFIAAVREAEKSIA